MSHVYFPLGDVVISEEDIMLENKLKKKKILELEKNSLIFPGEEIPGFWTRSIP